MRFTIELRDLVKMIELLKGKALGRKRSDSVLRLTASSPRVFVEANGIVSGIEALVLTEGSCLLPRTKFLKVLKTFHPKKNVTISADKSYLQIESFMMPLAGFSDVPTPPDEFQTIPVTDEWVAGKKAPEQASMPLSHRVPTRI